MVINQINPIMKFSYEKTPSMHNFLCLTLSSIRNPCYLVFGHTQIDQISINWASINYDENGFINTKVQQSTNEPPSIVNKHRELSIECTQTIEGQCTSQHLIKIHCSSVISISTGHWEMASIENNLMTRVFLHRKSERVSYKDVSETS